MGRKHGKRSGREINVLARRAVKDTNGRSGSGRVVGGRKRPRLDLISKFLFGPEDSVLVSGVLTHPQGPWDFLTDPWSCEGSECP